MNTASNNQHWERCVCCGEKFDALTKLMRHMEEHSEQEILLALSITDDEKKLADIYIEESKETFTST